MSEKINLNSDKLKAFYEQFGSSSFRLQSEMSKDYGKKYLTLFYKSVDSIYHIVTTIGIVAGFGFTALGYIENNVLFIFGEILLFSAIGVGIWAIQKIYISERKNFEGLHSKINLYFSERNDLFKLVFNRATANNLTSDDVNQIQVKDRELLDILKNSPEVEKDRKDILTPVVRAIFILFVVGGALLLLSFLCVKI